MRQRNAIELPHGIQWLNTLDKIEGNLYHKANKIGGYRMTVRTYTKPHTNAQDNITSPAKRKATGAHYTPKMLSDFVAREIVKAWVREKETTQKDRSASIRIIDPAVGDGQLLLSVLGELYQAGFTHFQATGFDTDPNALEQASIRIYRSFSNIDMELREKDFLEFSMTYGAGRLFSFGFEHFDLAIANPPYVRTQVMGAQKAQQITRQFGLSGRVDLYYAFISGLGMVMNTGGIAGIIVSNRFMTTKSGKSVRSNILNTFDVLHVWDLGDTRLFEAAVLPAVLLVRKKTKQSMRSTNIPQPRPAFTSIYAAEANQPKVNQRSRKCTNVISALEIEGLVQLPNEEQYIVQQGTLKHGNKPGDIWRLATTQSEQWLATVTSHTYCTFSDIGQVKVGIKTTADDVFIKSDWEALPSEEQPEVLMPLITHHIARRFKAQTSDKPKRVLYTHQVRHGKRVAINLQEFPRTARYLNHHRSKLAGRKYVLEAGREWFEIWVPHDPDTWSQPKIVFRDIAEKPTFWMDLSGSVVNGDCYWITYNIPQQSDMLWLILGVGNSSFIETFYDYKFRNKLYAGRRRFMTQYVKQFPLPHPDSVTAKQIIHLAKDIYHLLPTKKTRALEEKLDGLVWQAFGFPEKPNPAR